MMVRACVLLLLVLMAPLAGASDEEWRDLELRADNHPAQVLQEATEALRQAKMRDDKAGQLKALRLRLLARGITGADPDEGEDADAGSALARELKDMDAVAWFLQEQAWLDLEGGRHKDSVLALDRALAIAEQHGLRRTLALVQFRKGEILARLGQNSDALGWLSKAYARFKYAQDNLGMALTLKVIMRIYSADDASDEDKAKAIEYGKQGLTLVDGGANAGATASGLLMTLGNVHLSLKDYPKAKQYLEQCLIIKRRMRGVEGKAEAMYRLARVAQEEGRYIDALGYLNEILPQFIEIGRTRRIIQTQALRGDVLAQLGRKQESLQALEAAQPLLSQANSPEADVFYFERAAEIHAHFGNHQQAYRQLAELRKAEKRFAETANTKLSSELKVRFDVQLKEAENALLRAQQEEAESRRLALYLMLLLSFLVLVGVVVYLRGRAAAAKSEAVHQRALAAAEAAANRARGAFLANMSHELRSPLNAMLGFSRLLVRDTNLPHETRDDLRIILKSGEHLYTLINQVLDLSKIEAGQITLRQKDFDFV